MGEGTGFCSSVRITVVYFDLFRSSVDSMYETSVHVCSIVNFEFFGWHVLGIGLNAVCATYYIVTRSL